MGFEDGDAVGTGIETGIGQAVVWGWDRVVFGEKGIGDQVVGLCFRSSALSWLTINEEKFTLALKGLGLTAEQIAARKNVPTRFNCILTLLYAGDESLIQDLRAS